MTLPSASSLTDEQLRVLCAEADGYEPLKSISEIKRHNKHVWFPKNLPDPLHDASAALALLGEHWAANALNRKEVSVAIFRPERAYIGSAPDFCRAIVLSFLRAEGKIL